MEGARKAQSAFGSEIRELRAAHKEAFSDRPMNKELKQLVKWTNTRFKETTALLKQNVKDERISEFEGAQIYPYLTSKK